MTTFYNVLNVKNKTMIHTHSSNCFKYNNNNTTRTLHKKNRHFFFT